MEYNLVSGDSHVDLSWLPGDLFVENAPEALKDKVPRIEETDEGPRWIAEGRVLGVANAAGHGFSAPVRGMRKRIDRMWGRRLLRGRPPIPPRRSFACRTCKWTASTPKSSTASPAPA